MWHPARFDAGGKGNSASQDKFRDGHTLAPTSHLIPLALHQKIRVGKESFLPAFSFRIRLVCDKRGEGLVEGVERAVSQTK